MELKKFFCKNCTWSGTEKYNLNRNFECPDCGEILYFAPGNTPKKSPYFEETSGKIEGIWPTEDGKWKFICACGMGEIWRTYQLADENYKTHLRMHEIVDESFKNMLKKGLER